MKETNINIFPILLSEKITDDIIIEMIENYISESSEGDLFLSLDDTEPKYIENINEINENDLKIAMIADIVEDDESNMFKTISFFVDYNYVQQRISNSNLTEREVHEMIFNEKLHVFDTIRLLDSLDGDLKEKISSEMKLMELEDLSEIHTIINFIDHKDKVYQIIYSVIESDVLDSDYEIVVDTIISSDDYKEGKERDKFIDRFLDFKLEFGKGFNMLNFSNDDEYFDFEL